jgi:hypothetical protein
MALSLRWNLTTSPTILDHGTTWERHKTFQCTFRPFCKKMRVILLSR